MKYDNTTLGPGYVSYDNHREFGRMVAAFDELMEQVRPTLYRCFDRQELCHLADMRDYLFAVNFNHDDATTALPVLNCAGIMDDTRRASTVAQVCAATLKLIDRARLATGGTVGSPDAVSELTDFCLWQWQHPCPGPDEP